jgi:Phosphoribosylcarboxyaminoimidazole (NCAIR) mutase
MTVLPVIGVPLSGSVLDGTDALYSIVQMPPGIPVATVAINGAKNAAWLALEIMSIKHEDVRQRLMIERRNMAEAAEKANAEVIAKFEN